jgi:hypothetical protein
MPRKKKPTALLVKVMFSVEAEAAEPDLRERLEWALNEACAAFEKNDLKQKFIRYSIKEVIDLD